MQIDVLSITGPHCITAEDGEMVFQLIAAELTDGGTVELMFDGTEVYSTPFFNAAIGSLLRDYEPAELNQRVLISGLPPEGDEVLRRVIMNSRDYFQDGATRTVVDKALTDPFAWS